MTGAIEIVKFAKRYQALGEPVPLQPGAQKGGYEAAVEHLHRLLGAGAAIPRIRSGFPLS